MQSPPFGWMAGGTRCPPGSPCVGAGPEHIRSSVVSLAVVRRLTRSRPRISLTPVVYPLGPPWQPSSGSEDHSPLHHAARRAHRACTGLCLYTNSYLLGRRRNVVGPLPACIGSHMVRVGGRGRSSFPFVVRFVSFSLSSSLPQIVS